MVAFDVGYREYVTPHFDLFASMEAARDVGGDFYDFYMLDGSRLVLTIADV